MPQDAVPAFICYDDLWPLGRLVLMVKLMPKTNMEVTKKCSMCFCFMILTLTLALHFLNFIFNPYMFNVIVYFLIQIVFAVMGT